MLIGEAPGANEDRLGRPFVGKAGQLLDQALEDAGLSRDEVYITNAVKCRPPENRPPEPDELQACMFHLVNELEEVRPERILCLGGSAAKALVGKANIGATRGQTLFSRTGVPVSVTYHPSAALRAGGVESEYYKALVSDIRQAAGLGETRRVNASIHYQKSAGAAAALGRLERADVLALDLEWLAGEGGGMLWPWNPRSRALSLSVSGRVAGEIVTVACALPLTYDASERLLRLLESKPVVAHNAMADLQWCKWLDWPVNVIGDTMLLAYAHDPERKRGLEALAMSALDEVEWKTPLWTRPPQDERTWAELLQYNATDTYMTLRLWEHFTAMVSEETRRVHDQLLIPALEVLAEAAYVGVPMDVDGIKRELDRLVGERNSAIEDLAVECELPYGAAAKIPSSPPRVQRLLSERYGLDLDGTQEKELREYVEDYSVIGLILRARGLSKLIGTYLKPWLELLQDQGDERLHTVYRLTGTRTGRISAELERGGSLQLMPREKWVRRLVQAPEGSALIAADYSQIELRVAAWIAQEETMLGFFREGIDLHRATAAYMRAWRDDGLTLGEFWPRRAEYIDAVTKEQRQAAKGVNFGLIYRMQADSLARYARDNYGVDMSFEDAQAFHTAFFRLYPALTRWHRTAVRDAERSGYCETPFGRRRDVSQDASKAINTPVQSMASDLTLLAMAEIARTVRHGTVIGFVHDSVLIEAPRLRARAIAKKVKATMEAVTTEQFGFTLDVPLVADVEIGERWG